MKTAVLVDSACDLNFLQAEALGLHLLLHTTSFEGQNWLDHSELPNSLLFSRLRAGAAHPVIRPTTEAGYFTVIERLLSRHEHVFAIHPARYLDDTVQVARRAGQRFGSLLTIHESQGVSVSLALQAVRAGQLLGQGVPPAQVREVLRQVEQSSASVVAIDNAQFMRRGGYFKDARVTLMTLMNAKVISGIERGQEVTFGLPRSTAAAVSTMERTFRRHLELFAPARVGLFHVDAPARVQALEAAARDAGATPLVTVEVGPVLAAHLGPGAYGYTTEPQQVWQNFRQY